MKDCGLKYPMTVGAATLTVCLIFLVDPAPVKAADLNDYYAIGEQVTVDHPSIQRRVIVEERYGAPIIEYPTLERQVRPPVIEEQILGQPIVEQRVIERRAVPTVVEFRAVRRVVEHAAEPVLIPPQNVPPVPQRVARPVAEFGMTPPMKECRTVVTERLDAFGGRVVESTRTCN